MTHESDDRIGIGGFLLNIAGRKLREVEAAQVIEPAYKALDVESNSS
ncbi:MAG: hypothetical protein HQK87_00700 [Nitrospinae bacterium]|nr:hypothetical protein [Nitrospinota bacterium]